LKFPSITDERFFLHVQGKWTVKSDVWSFGVTLWEILTLAKSLPFGNFTNQLVIDNLVHIQQTGEPKVKQ
jgi:discoidin domain receptor family protein 2